MPVEYYKDMYTSIDAEVIQYSKELLVDKRVYRQTEPDKLILFKEWLQKVSEHYHIPVPRLAINFDAQHSGFYRHTDNYIELPKFSVVTLFHEFKHHKDIVERGRTTEEQARGWSMSLFYKASPYHYDRAVAKGIIIFVTRNNERENVIANEQSLTS